jgi:hypothetical protein
MAFTNQDLRFLKSLKIAADPEPAPIQVPFDETSRILQELGIPITRENYLRLAFGGRPPEEPLDGEIESELQDVGAPAWWFGTFEED